MRLFLLLSLSLLIEGMSICAAQTPASATPTVALQPGGNRALDILKDGLRDRNPDTRKQAVESLGLAGPREPFLSQAKAALEDKDLEVRLAAIDSIVDLKHPQTVRAMQNLLDDRTPEISFAAAKALWVLDEASGREAMISLLSGESKNASRFLAQQKRETLRMLHTPKTLLRFAMETSFDFAPVPELDKGVSSVEGILSDPGVTGRAAIALLLGPDPHPEALVALRHALTDKNGSVRAAACHAIALRDDPALLPDLAKLLDDKTQAVRLRAAAGYLRLEWIKTHRQPPIPAPPIVDGATAPRTTLATSP